MAQLPYSDTFKLRVPFGDEGRGKGGRGSVICDGDGSVCAGVLG